MLICCLLTWQSLKLRMLRMLPVVFFCSSSERVVVGRTWFSWGVAYGHILDTIGSGNGTSRRLVLVRTVRYTAGQPALDLSKRILREHGAVTAHRNTLLTTRRLGRLAQESDSQVFILLLFLNVMACKLLQLRRCGTNTLCRFSGSDASDFISYKHFCLALPLPAKSSQTRKSAHLKSSIPHSESSCCSTSPLSQSAKFTHLGP